MYYLNPENLQSLLIWDPVSTLIGYKLVYQDYYEITPGPRHSSNLVYYPLDRLVLHCLSLAPYVYLSGISVQGVLSSGVASHCQVPPLSAFGCASNKYSGTIPR